MQGAVAVMLAVTMGVAGASKLESSARFREALQALVPAEFVEPLRWAIPASELALAAWLVSGVAPAAAAAATLLTLGVFSLALLRLRRADRSGGCGCFGEPADPSEEHPRLGLGRNAVLTLAAAWLVLAPGYDALWEESFSTAMAQVTIAIGALCAWYCVSALVVYARPARQDLA